MFFDNANPLDGRYAFLIYDSVTGKRLFEDTAYYHNGSSRVGVFRTKAGYLLGYLRVADVDCNGHADERPCWEKVEAKLALKTKPVCMGYDHNAVESRVAYPVEVTLLAHPTIKPAAGPAKCRPQE